MTDPVVGEEENAWAALDETYEREHPGATYYFRTPDDAELSEYSVNDTVTLPIVERLINPSAGQWIDFCVIFVAPGRRVRLPMITRRSGEVVEHAFPVQHNGQWTPMRVNDEWINQQRGGLLASMATKLARCARCTKDFGHGDAIATVPGKSSPVHLRCLTPKDKHRATGVSVHLIDGQPPTTEKVLLAMKTVKEIARNGLK